MAADTIKRTLRGCKGTDTESNPLGLWAEWQATGYGYTDSASDIYSDGSFLGQKRPGMAQAGAAAAPAGTDPAIFDLVAARLRGTDTLPGRDVLFGLFRRPTGGGASDVGAAYWYPQGSHAIVDLGSVASDVSLYARLIPAGLDSVFITPTGDFPVVYRLSRDATDSTRYARVRDWIEPAGRAALVGAWHKFHLFLAGYVGAGANGTADRSSMLIHSPFNNPMGPFAANDNFNAGLRGVDPVMGLISAGETLFIGKSAGIWRVTGSLSEDFRLEQVPSPFGFVGMRAVDVLAPETVVGFICEKAWATTTTPEGPIASNVAIITAGKVEPIGNRVLTAIRTSADIFNEARVKSWPALRGALLIPDIQGITQAATSALFMSTDTLGFWPWTIGAAMMPDSLEYAGRDMYAGCGDGLIRRFLASASQDGSANFTPYFDSPVMDFGRQVHIERADITAQQTSGGTWTAQVARNFGSMGTAVNFATAIATTPTRSRAKFTGDAATARYQRVRVNMPTNGVSSKLFTMEVYAKPIGGDDD